MTLTYWIALGLYLAIGVILWGRFPSIRATFSQKGYYRGLILFVAFWPVSLVWFAHAMMLLRTAANVDTAVRLEVFKRFMAENPQSADESKHEYMRRGHWAVLTTCGLPPLSIVKFWLRSNKPYILAPTDQIERYMLETEGKPLPDGELDPQVRNGQGRMILQLLWSLEKSKRRPEDLSQPL